MELRNKKVFITGGLGFIGKHLVKKIERDNEVIVYDNFLRGFIDERELAENGRSKIVKGDVLDSNLLRKHMAGCDIVFHLAAICGIQSVTQKPVETIEVNFLGTHNVLKVAKDLQVERVLVASTSEVYGQLAFKVDEDTSTTQGPISEARWGYAVSKLATEYLSLAFHNQYGLNVTTVRPFNIYGPGQIGEGAIHNFIVNALRDEPIRIYGDGTQIRAWCYIDDLIRGLLLACSNLKAIGKSFNLGNPQETITVYRLAKLIKRITNSKSRIEFVQRRTPVIDVYVRVPDITRAKELLEFNPKVSLEEGLPKTIEYYSSLSKKSM